MKIDYKHNLKDEDVMVLRCWAEDELENHIRVDYQTSIPNKFSRRKPDTNTTPKKDEDGR